MSDYLSGGGKDLGAAFTGCLSCNALPRNNANFPN